MRTMDDHGYEGGVGGSQMVREELSKQKTKGDAFLGVLVRICFCTFKMRPFFMKSAKRFLGAKMVNLMSVSQAVQQTKPRD